VDEQKDENQDITVTPEGALKENQSNDTGTNEHATNDISGPNEVHGAPDLDSTNPPPALQDVTHNDTSSANSDASDNAPSAEVKQPPLDQDLSEDTNDISMSDESPQQSSDAMPTPTLTGAALAAAAEAEMNGDKSNNDSSQVQPSAQTSAQPTAPADVVTKPAHHNNKKFIAILTVLLALLIAGAAVYLYISTQNATQETENTSEGTQQSDTAQTEPASAADVDQTNQEVDDALNALDDTADFDEQQLSDENLGL